MNTGVIFREVVLKSGNRVVLRAPRWEDLDGYAGFINGLVSERADIMRETPVTREEEADWLARKLSEIEKHQTVMILADAQGSVVGNCEIQRWTGNRNHVGYLGISVSKDYREIGLGTELMRATIDEARKMSLKVLVLDLFERNERAHRVYKKTGFVDAGKIPKCIFRDGKYEDQLRMVMEL